MRLGVNDECDIWVAVHRAVSSDGTCFNNKLKQLIAEVKDYEDNYDTVPGIFDKRILIAEHLDQIRLNHIWEMARVQEQSKKSKLGINYSLIAGPKKRWARPRAQNCLFQHEQVRATLFIPSP